MKSSSIFIFFIFFFLSGYIVSAVASSEINKQAESETIGVNDTIFFDLSNAVMTSTYIDVPVFFTSDDTVFAVDFSFKFNESRLTYDSIINHKPYITPLANFNQADRKLRFTSSSLQPVEHNEALISVRFLFNGGVCDKITKQDFNTIKAYLNGDLCSYKFIGAPLYGLQAAFGNSQICAGYNVTFNDASTITGTGGTITSWSWNLGNGVTSTSQQPPVTSYTVIGTYSITLIVTSSAGCADTLKKPIYVNAAPVADFSFAADCNVDSVLFADNSTISSESISGWSWNFGDLTSSALQNPYHTYTVGGTYTVSLVVSTNAGCTSSHTDVLFVEVLTANFNAPGACLGTSTTFTNSSTATTGVINGWNWNFGDGNTSTQESPLHTYTTSGTFTVTLAIVTNQNCKDTLVKTVTINPKPVVNFSADTLSGCIPLPVVFSDASVTPPGSTYFWNFGDSDTSLSQNPVHTYTTSGGYTVTHVVITSAGCKDSLVQNGYINVYDVPVANFSAPTVCLGSIITFANNSTTPPGTTLAGWNWNFGDGNTSTQQSPMHTYTAAGTYTADLTVTTDQGCSNNIIKTVVIEAKPVVNFSADVLSGCVPLDVNFSDASTTSPGSSYYWLFGDSNSSPLTNPAHTYSASGQYAVTHIVTTTAGCSDTLVMPSYITVHAIPTASFISTPGDTAILPDASIAFADLSSGDINWLWNFGDGDSSLSENPVHMYTAEGIYAVCLTVYNSFGCLNNTCNTITVVSPEVPEVAVGVPSGFTPNGDNSNDFLFVRGPMKEMVLRIFNEWGNEIFETNSQKIGWDGKFNGTPQPVGSYLYTLKGVTVAGAEVQIHGVVNLIR